MQKRDAKAAAAIGSAWTYAPRDGVGFIMKLNERRLWLARDERGNYFAVDQSGFAHRLHDKDMHEAVDAVRRDNSELVIPTIAEQRDHLADEYERERQRIAAQTAATLYNRASMPSQQRDALVHIQERREHREAVQRQQEREQKKQDRASGKTQEPQHDQSGKTQEPQRDQAAQKREDKKDRTEQTAAQQSRARREELREQLGLHKQGGKERDDGGGRERER